jgi:molybdenum cofactor cytidylyltransferase
MISAILLAAGFSSRMHENKLKLPYGQATVMDHVLLELLKSSADEIIVVHKEDQFFEGVVNAINDHPEMGMTSSIQTGIKHCSKDSNGFMICLGDMVKLCAQDYNKLLSAFKKQTDVDSNCIIVPRFNGQKGNPVIFSSSYHNEIMTHTETEGCRQIIKQHQQHIFWVDMDTDAVLIDIDTPEDYRRLTQTKG